MQLADATRLEGLLSAEHEPRARRTLRRILGIVALTAAVLAILPAARASAYFQWSAARQMDAGLFMADVSCPSSTQCTAVGPRNGYSGLAADEVTFNPQTPGNPTATPMSTSGKFLALSCPSTTQCTTVGNGAELTFNPQTVGQPGQTGSPVTVDSGAQLSSVSCPLTSQCTAVDGTSGTEVTFDPGMPSGASTGQVDATGDLRGVTCPASTECVAIDDHGGATSFDPSNPSGAASFNVTGSTSAVLQYVACPSLSECVVSGTAGQLATFNPQTQVTRSITLSPSDVYSGMSCPQTTLCLTTGSSGVVSFDPTSTSNIATSVGVLASAPISCLAANQCTASNGYGETSFDPGNPSSETSAQFIPGVSGVSCPALNQCTLADHAGGYVTYDPTTDRRLSLGFAGGAMIAPSCPDADQCTVAETNGFTRTFDPQTGSSPTLSYVTDAASLTSLMCASDTQCTLGESSGDETTVNPQSPGPLSNYVIDSGSELTGLACPVATECVAVDQAGAETEFNPQLPRDYAPVVIDPNQSLTGVACPSADQCTAVDASGQEVTFDPIAPTSPQPVVIDPGESLTSIACASTTLCVSVDDNGQSADGNPQDTSTPWRIATVSGTSSLTGISCPTASRCIAVDSTGEVGIGSYLSAAPVPVATQPPVVSGSPVVGQTLTETNGTYTNNPTSFSYQWEDCDASGTNCTPISGATSQSYSLTSSDAGFTIVVSEIASNSDGPGAATASAPTASVTQPPAAAQAPPPSTSTPQTTPTATVPVAASSGQAPVFLTRPRISGTAIVGRKLTTTTGEASGTPTVGYRFQWLRCSPSCAPIPHATGQSYSVSTADAGHELSAAVTAYNATGTSSSQALSVGPVKRAATAPVKVPSAQSIASALRGILAPSGRLARPAAVLKADGFVFAFHSPGAGFVGLNWSEIRGIDAKPVRVASIRLHLRGAGRVDLKIVLNARGRAILRRSRKLRLSASASFTPTTGRTVSRERAFTLPR